MFKANKRRSCNLQILINEQAIEQVNETVFLDVIFNENPNWKTNVACGQYHYLSKSIGMI